VKADEDTPVTVPDAPPAAGPDRALDPPPPDPEPPADPPPAAGCPVVVDDDAAGADGDVGVAEEDVPSPTETPITALSTAAATIHMLFLFDSHRRVAGRRGSTAGTEAEGPGNDAGGGGPPGVSLGSLGSYSFIVALLALGSLSRDCRRLL
jgi:hypothetical protein